MDEEEGEGDQIWHVGQHSTGQHVTYGPKTKYVRKWCIVEIEREGANGIYLPPCLRMAEGLDGQGLTAQGTLR